ncbi:MAG: LCP family protein [Acidimicrobiales bacterium]
MSQAQRPDDAPQPRTGRHAVRKRRRSRVARAGRAVGIFVVVVFLLVGGLYAYSQYRYHQIPKLTLHSLSPIVASQPINILLVGSNTRTGLKASQVKYFGSATQVGGARSDVTMIAHFNPATSQVSLLSIPRDLFMPIPNTNLANRVDSELNVSPDQLVRTVEQDLGIPIQHFVELNFDSFQNVVNALGGVRMDFPMPVRDAYSGLNVTTTGCQTLNGFQALEVVRARHLEYYSNGVWTEDPLGDLSRIRRDHEFLKVLAAEVKQKGLSNPFTLNSILSGIVKYLKVDSSFTFNNMVALALKYRNASVSAAQAVTLPVALENGPNNGGYYYNGANYGDIVFPAEPQDTQLIDKTLGLSVPKISPSAITVSVLNGTGAYQQAASVAHSLKALGYRIGTIGNATVTSTSYPQTENPTETIVQYEPGHLPQAEVVKNSLSGAVIMGQINHTSTGAGVQVITGTGLVVATPSTTPTTSSATHAKKSSKGSTTSSSNATTTTTAPNTAPYSLPATLSNQPLQPWDPRACSSSSG